jgi:hypothetical protein
LLFLSKKLRKILDAAPVLPREELVHDVALFVLYLAGMNTVDCIAWKKQSFEAERFPSRRQAE